MAIKWEEKHIINTELPKKLKKITGTRFGAILGKNKWSSPFQVWCEITKTYEPPFEDSKYTIAGKTIEPKQAQYLKRSFFMDELVTPTDRYGEDYFNKTYGDFYPHEPVFGGMWDYLNYEEGKLQEVIECKTTQRAEDWDGSIPEHYSLQASLYAWLLGVEKVIMVCSFLEENDYVHPENYVVNATNTIVKEFNVHDLFPNFEDLIKEALDFWTNHVVTGISPDYDEKVDEKYLKELRKNNLNPDTDIQALADEYETLASEINEVLATIEEKQARLEKLKSLLKGYLEENLREGDKQSTFTGKKYQFVLSVSNTKTIDKEALKRDGLLGVYEKTSTSTRFTTKEIKEEK